MNTFHVSKLVKPCMTLSGIVQRCRFVVRTIEATNVFAIIGIEVYT